MENSDIPVLSSKEVSWIISNRSHLPHKLYLSIKGCITALSEKLRVKNDDVFLLEIDHSVFVIVKDYHLSWHSQLVPLETFVFYQLRLTTLEKGLSKALPILVAWKTSRIVKGSEIESIICSTLKKWMSWMHLENSLMSTNLASACNHEPQDETLLPYFSGKVTKVVEVNDGIYELDSNVRLLTWLNSSIRGDLCLHMGCNVQVYNAHKIEDAIGRTVLVCCSHSLIKSDVDPVIKCNMKAAQNSLRQQKLVCSLNEMKSFISKYGLNFREVEILLALRDSLKNGNSRKEVKYILHYLIQSFCCATKERDNSSILDTFLRHEEFCPFTHSKSSQCRLQTQLNVSWLHESNVVNMEESNDPKWNYRWKEWDNEKILLGSVIVNEEGQCEFVDQSGKMPVIIYNQWSEQDVSQGFPSSDFDNHSDKQSKLSRSTTAAHQCTCLCQKSIDPPKKLSCPFLSPAVVGKMFYTNKFYLVSEYFHEGKEGCEPNESNTLRYLMFSLLNCIMLESVDYGSVSDTDNYDSLRRFNNSNKSQPHQNYVMSNESQIACLVYVSEKYQSLYSERDGKCFKLGGRIVDPDLLIEDSYENVYQNKKENKPSTQHEEESVMTCDVSIKINDKGKPLKRKFETLYSVSGERDAKKKKSEDSEGENQSTSFRLPLSRSVPIVMNLFKGNDQIYPFIQPGHFHLFSSSRGSGKNFSNCFQPVFSNEKLGKAAKKCNVKMCIEVAETLDVKLIFGNSTESIKAAFDMDILPAVSVTQMLLEQFEQSVVSFTAIVVRRKSSKKISACPYLRDVQLDLCDLEMASNCHQTTDYVSLYFDTSQKFYVRGLIPGSVIEVCNVVRKVSKLNNVYCKFIAVSSLHLKSFLPLQVCRSSEDRMPSTSCDFTQFPKEYIGTIWNSNPENVSMLRHVWHIQCHVCTVFTLKLQLSCKNCGGLFSNGCQSRGCNNTESFEVVTFSVVLVDDGTSQALMKLKKPALVRKLLTLSESQWSGIISLLQDTGQVFISMRADASSSNQKLETFLTDLINSSLVIRPLKILGRISKDSPCRETVDKMKMEEFLLKNLRHGGSTQKVLHLPFLNLDCVDLEEEC